MLEKIDTQKQFMDELDRMNTHEDEDSERGKNTDLKSYIIETDEPLQNQYEFGDAVLKVTDTGLEHVKILTVEKNARPHIQYYVDKTNERFLVLHSNAGATESDEVVERMTSNKSPFDNAWLYSDLLKFIAKNFGDKPCGYGIKYEDIFKADDSLIEPKNDLRMDITGKISNEVFELIQQNSNINQILSYEKISFTKGTQDDGVLENLKYNGRFRLIKGDSIDEHVGLVESVMDKYHQVIKDIERERIRVESQDGGLTVAGTPFTFEFGRHIENWNEFLPRIFNALDPFRIWGLNYDVGDGMQKILCVDMHSGDALDVEVKGGVMRAYLPKGACGNVILRLYTNLQRYVDANLTCRQLVT